MTNGARRRGCSVLRARFDSCPTLLEKENVMPETRKALIAGLTMLPLLVFASDDLDALLTLPGDKPATPRIAGFVEGAAAYTFSEPTHWSKLRVRGEASAGGQLGSGVKWKLGARADMDGAYTLEDDFYPSAVQRNQRSELSLREAYLDVSAGEWDFRLGRQHVIWGEMVGLFFADVVSARDTREFYLPEFDQLRIPQWAARAEYFMDDVHAELLWIPFPAIDNIGKPGSDFYGFVPTVPNYRIAGEERPEQRLGNSNWGARLSTLVSGWDMSAFFYRSTDVSPTYYGSVDLTGGAPVVVFTPRHDRIRQVGGTFSKDLGGAVFKGELVHTHGRALNTADPAAPNGLHETDMADMVVGLDVPVRDVWRVNGQLFGRRHFSADPLTGVDANETGYSLLLNRSFGDSLEAEVLYVATFNRGDFMVRPKVVWQMDPLWRLQGGVDLFGGDRTGLFGRFDHSDRAYVEVRRSF